MAWDTNDIDDDIITQDGTFAYLFKASGNLYAGQAVYIIADNTVCAGIANAEGIGVVDHDVTHGNQVAVYGPGNVVRLCLDAAGSAGGAVYCDAGGVCDTTIGSAERIMGYQLEAATSKTTNYFGKVLLV